MEDESLSQQRGVIVERGAVEKQQALLIDENLRALGPLEYLVAEPRLLVPRERIAETGAASTLDADTQTALADALLRHQRLDLLRCGL
jgi:hypothetical protein